MICDPTGGDWLEEVTFGGTGVTNCRIHPASYTAIKGHRVARRRKTRSELAALLHRVRHVFDGSPLQAVGDRLAQCLSQTEEAVTCGLLATEQTRPVGESILTCLDALPNSFGERFFFDAWLIQSVATHWSAAGPRFSSMVVPKYADTWGHLSVPMPGDDRARTHVVDVILLPGDDGLESVDLLDYPWLCHELGHNLHFRNDEFAVRFRPGLDRRLSSIRSRSVADRGAARTKSAAMIEKIRQFWTPTPTHKNWPHEIAADLTAVWTVGPSFLATVQDFLEQEHLDPYLLRQEHPPYDVRVAAMVDAAERLGWGDYAAPLREIKSAWASGSYKAGRTNELAALADVDLISACVTEALAFCHQTQLPRATPEHIETLRESLERDDGIEPGTDLLITGWLAEKHFDENAFGNWQNSIVHQIALEVMQESR